MANMPPISDVFKAGTLFDYAAWTNDSIITLANVPFNSEYDDVSRPDLAQARVDAYIDAQAATNVNLDKMTYARFDAPIRIATPFNIANQYNYVRVTNPIQNAENPDIQKDYYYFIMSVGFVNPGTTQITVMLDAWTTFGKHFTVTQAYVERSHLGIANMHGRDAFGRDYLTVPEGREYGGEYRINDARRLKIMSNTPGSEGLEGWPIPQTAPGYDMLVATTVDINADPGTVDNPVLNTAKGGMIQGLMSGASFYVFNGASGFSNYLTNNSEKPWVTQGIINATIIPRVDRYLPGFDYNPDAASNANMAPAPMLPYPTLTHKMYENWRENVITQLPEKYRHLWKFLTYPYCVLEMTTWNATPLILKPEMWADPDMTVTESASIVPPSQRIVFSPQRYNAKPDSPIVTKHSWFPDLAGFPYPNDLGDGDDGGEWMDVTTLIANFVTVPIVNNSAIAYLASNKNSLAFQHSSADWSQERAGQAISAGIENANTGVGATRAGGDVSRGLASSMMSNSVDTANESMIANAVAGIATGTAGGAVGGPGGMLIGAGMSTAGAIASGVQTGIQNQSMARSTSMQNRAGLTSQEIGIGASQTIAQTNAGLAARAAAGDKMNTIAGINAKVQDAKLTQPTTVGQMGGESFNLVMDNVELAVRVKMIDPAAIRSIGDYWLKYGYAVQAFTKVPTNLMAMSKFTFWKMQDPKLATGNFPEFYKNIIKGILIKGTTVWDNPADMAATTIDDNTALPNMTIGY